jgi:LacI family transcriptional regulator
VDEVAGFAGLSRRMLENRFRKLLGRSVMNEIRRVRTEQIARLLLETDLPVAQIADLLGFADVRHIARYFRAGKGISPLAYRKTYGSLELVGWRSRNGDSFPQSGVASTL